MAITPRAKAVINFDWLSKDDRALIGSMESKAGNIVIDKIQANIAPNAAKLPMSRMGGVSIKFKLAKPIAVVTLVKKTGPQFTRRLSTIASFFESPRCIPIRVVIRM